VQACHQRGALTTSIVRPGDVYGPGDRVSLLPVAGLLETGRLPLIAGGERLGAFTYVENLADGLILAGTHDAARGETYVITDGVKLTWRRYFEKLTTALDVPPPRCSVPPGVAWAAASILEAVYRRLRIRRRPPITRYLVAHLSHDVHFSIAKARRELGYAPRVDVDEAIARTAAWYRRTVRGTPEAAL
jgi:nucleoside-diphosphate-sugar epimerase